MSLRKIIPGGLPNLLSFFGLTQDGNEDLSVNVNGEVVPAVLVGSLVTLSANSTPMVHGVPYTAGELVAPAVNTVLADTGPLPAGTYNVRLIVSGLNVTASWRTDFRLQRRDAANAANIWSQAFQVWEGSPRYDAVFAITLAANERLRIITVAATSAGEPIQGSIWANFLA